MNGQIPGKQFVPGLKRIYTKGKEGPVVNDQTVPPVSAAKASPVTPQPNNVQQQGTFPPDPTKKAMLIPEENMKLLKIAQSWYKQAENPYSAGQGFDAFEAANKQRQDELTAKPKTLQQDYTKQWGPGLAKLFNKPQPPAWNSRSPRPDAKPQDLMWRLPNVNPDLSPWEGFLDAISLQPKQIAQPLQDPGMRAFPAPKFQPKAPDPHWTLSLAQHKQPVMPQKPAPQPPVPPQPAPQPPVQKRPVRPPSAHVMPDIQMGFERPQSFGPQHPHWAEQPVPVPSVAGHAMPSIGSGPQSFGPQHRYRDIPAEAPVPFSPAAISTMPDIKPREQQLPVQQTPEPPVPVQPAPAQVAPARAYDAQGHYSGLSPEDRQRALRLYRSLPKSQQRSMGAQQYRAGQSWAPWLRPEFVRQVPGLDKFSKDLQVSVPAAATAGGLLGAGYGMGRAPGGEAIQGAVRGGLKGMGTGLGAYAGDQLVRKLVDTGAIEHPLLKFIAQLSGIGAGALGGNLLSEFALGKLMGSPRDRRYDISDSEIEELQEPK